MPQAVIRRLRHGADLSAAEEEALRAQLQDVHEVRAHKDLIRQGERPQRVHVVLEGMACRYKLLEDGSRQILAWVLPGDFCDLHVAVLGMMDHALATLAPSRIAFMPLSAVDTLSAGSPALARAFWWATLVDEAVLREWLVNMGRRSADRQVAHLFCELVTRLAAVGLVRGGTVDLPVTQVELADTLGLSSVHVNRVLQQLRDDGLIQLYGKRLRIADFAALQAFAQFDPGYLHLTDRPQALARQSG